jgi:hypothetical protein
MGTTMHEIERILMNNLGNRLTQELVIGLNAAIIHRVQALLSEQQQQLEAKKEKGKSHG